LGLSGGFSRVKVRAALNSDVQLYMTTTSFDEVLEVTNRKDLGEVGGANNLKGTAFAQHWVVMRMFDLVPGTSWCFLKRYKT
jgi:hypothetical protein